MRWHLHTGMACEVFLTLASFASATAAEQPLDDALMSQVSRAEVRCESLSIPVGAYEITETGRGQEVSVEGYGYLLEPGKPTLPSKILAVAIPPGAEVVDVTFDTGAGLSLPAVYRILPVQLPRVIGQENPAAYEKDRQTYEENFTSVYGHDEAYPQNVVEFVGTAGYRQYNLVDLRVTPFTYRPLSGQLTYYPDITVHVHYRWHEKTWDAVAQGSQRTERIAQDIIVNFDRVKDWYARGEAQRGLHDFVIVTLDSLTSAVTPLVDWETSKGRTVAVVTTTWIDTNYSGYDLAEKTRNFLRDKYPAGEWGIEDVLLVGHYDDVPMRRVEQDIGYGKPETDYYYAELSLPDNQSWDADGDHQYAEDSDPIDFYVEVNVGRIPWSDYATVLHICNKSVACEQNDNPAYKKNILLLGSFVSENTDTAVVMEAVRNQPWMADWTSTRMYEQNSTVYSEYPCDYELTHSNVMSVWPFGTYAFVNWGGHGSPSSCFQMGYGSAKFITLSDCSSLNDDYPAIIFAFACSNSNSDYFNIGQAMLQQGAVGFLGANKAAYGMINWNHPYDGSGQSFDYFFMSCVTSGDYTLGQAHQWALREMYTMGLWFKVKYEMLEWGAVWGNPDLAMAVPPPLRISFPDGRPEYLEPGVPTMIRVQIADAGESYVPGTGTLHYRYDDGSFLTAPLTHDSGDLYLASLPAADCDDTPEYYISAEGDGQSVVTSPPDAPDSVYGATVGTITVIMDDNFETDQGWTAVNLGASSGDWQRGVPVNDPDWFYDPARDSDASGQCHLTQNEYGNTDVDDGAVGLISPVIDMSAGGISVRYDYFLRLRFAYSHRGEDMLLVEINSNGGAGDWTEIARHDTNGGLSWRHHEITQADLDAAGVTLTPNMQLRFTANDADPQSINESGLDAFRVVAMSCTPVSPGDLNCDGQVDFEDINPFILALTDPDAYQSAYPDCNLMNADINSDGEVDFEDINPFVALLTGD